MIRRRILLVVAAAVVLVSATACGGSSSSSAGGARPHSDARLAIVSPTVNGVVHDTVELKLQLTGGEVVGPTNDPLVGNRGHIHVSLDGKLVSMTYGLDQRIPGVTPGQHTVQAEFVATDHRPYANRVIAAVVFVAR